jgi:thymidylate synthase (FAD)
LEIQLSTQLTATLYQSVGDDLSIIDAARVSTGTDGEYLPDARAAGLISYLVRNRHGSPFEHNSMTFQIDAPIFLAREFMRHRIGFSYNEVSARYKEMDPEFYVYPHVRPLVQSGSGAHPALVAGDENLYEIVVGEILQHSKRSWESYQYMLAAGAANEVARAVLPVNLYTHWYVTCNARSLMSFLSLRVDSPDNAVSTKPQWEIQQIAQQMEAVFAGRFPQTYAAFVANGRIAP